AVGVDVEEMGVAEGGCMREGMSGGERFVDDQGNVPDDGGETGQRPQCDAGRTIVAEFPEVKLGDPNFRWKIEGLRDFWVQRAGHSERVAGDLHDRGLAGVQESDLARRSPGEAPAVEAEPREEVLAHALQIQEVDRGPLRLDAARRPATRQQDRDGAGLLPRAPRIDPVSLPD